MDLDPVLVRDLRCNRGTWEHRERKVDRANAAAAVLWSATVHAGASSVVPPDSGIRAGASSMTMLEPVQEPMPVPLEPELELKLGARPSGRVYPRVSGRGNRDGGRCR